MHARKRPRSQDRTQISLSTSYREALDSLCALYACDRSSFVEALIFESAYDIPARLPGCATEMAYDFFVEALRKKSKAGDGPLSKLRCLSGGYSKYLQKPLLSLEEIEEDLTRPKRAKRVGFTSHFPRSKKCREAMTQVDSNDAFYPDPSLIERPPALKDIIYARTDLLSLSDRTNIAQKCHSILAEMIFHGMEQMRRDCLSIPEEVSKFEREDTKHILGIPKMAKAGLQPQAILLALKDSARKKALEQEKAAAMAKNTGPKTKDSKNVKRSSRPPSPSIRQ